MHLDLLKEMLAESQSQDNSEKIDYVKNLEKVKIKLRSELFNLLKDTLGQWTLNIKENYFSYTNNISYLFDDSFTHAQNFLSSYEEDILSQLQTLHDGEQLTIERQIHRHGITYHIREKITYLQKQDLYICSLKDFTKIKKINKDIVNIDKTIFNLIKVFDKNVILLQCNSQGILTYVSSAFCKITHFVNEDILGHNIEEFETKDTNSTSILSLFQDAFSQHKVLNKELKFIKQDRSFFWVNAFITPLSQGDSELSYTLVCYDITNQKLLEDIVNHDALTGVFNRRFYGEIIERELARCKRDNRMLAFAMIDIDYFKQYNDSYGHARGDAALIQVANSLQSNLRRGEDFLFRMGGEEFCVIFSGYDREKSFYFCQKLKDDIEALKIPHIASKVSQHITISIGLVVADLANEVIDELGLYTTSDNALYSAKTSGRNKIFVHPHGELDLF